MNISLRFMFKALFVTSFALTTIYLIAMTETATVESSEAREAVVSREQEAASVRAAQASKAAAAADTNAADESKGGKEGATADKVVTREEEAASLRAHKNARTTNAATDESGKGASVSDEIAALRGAKAAATQVRKPVVSSTQKKIQEQKAKSAAKAAVVKKK